MSGLAGIAPGALARLVGDQAALRGRLETLSAQAADGRRGRLYGDVAPDARRAMDLRGEIARRETHGVTLQRALGRTGAAQDALSRLSTVARDFLAESMKVSRADPNRISTLASGARQALQEVAGLLNERHAGEYLFGGQDTANPPIPNPGALMGSGMGADVAAAVASLTPTNGAAVLAGTRAAAQSDAPGTTPFSAYLADPARGLTEPRRTSLAGDGEVIETGLFANRNAAAASRGETTGSWARDLLRGLMTLASLDPAQADLGDGFETVMAGVRAGFASAADALGEEAGALGLSERRLESARARHDDLQVTLRIQLAGVEEVDLARTLVALQDTRTRLEASWQALARLSSLSLAQFLR